jgi:hypothetical protein
MIKLYIIKTTNSMKKLRVFSTLVIVISLIACEPQVTFTEPQPAGIDNLSKFPERLQGEYVSLNDSSTLQINQSMIRRMYDVEEKMHPSQLDSNTRLSGDTLLYVDTQQKEAIRREGDSLIVHIRYTDTIFQIDYDNVVRKYKGYYFLNKRYDKESWEVTKIEISKGELVLSGISTEMDLNNLQSITESSQDTIAPYSVTAEKKQFKEFIKQDGFSDREVFVRQRKN